MLTHFLNNESTKGMPNKDERSRGAGSTFCEDSSQKLPGQKWKPILDWIALIKAFPVVRSLHDPGGRKPIRQHSVIFKPVDLAVKPRLAGSGTDSRNCDDTVPAISITFLVVVAQAFVFSALTRPARQASPNHCC